MSDLTDRLRRWAIAPDAVPASDLMDEAADEIARLRLAICRLAEQDATLSVQGGNVIVEMDATLTDAEREAVRFCVTASLPETEKLGGVAGELCRMHAARLRSLLERMK